MPAPLMYIVWALMSAVCALGIAYPVIIRKMYRQVQYVDGSRFARFNAGRIFRLLICFVAAAIMMAGLLFESQKWSAVQWLVVLLAVPLYLGVTFLAEWLVKRQYKPAFQTKGVVLTSNVVTGLLMVAVYAAMVYMGSDAGYANITLAYLNTPQPFAESSSVIVSEIGKVTALGDATTEFLVAQTVSAFQPLAIVLRVSMCLAAFFGISSLLGLCLLNRDDFLGIFKPLQNLEGGRAEASIVKKYAIFAAVLPFLLMGVSCWAETEAQHKQAADEDTIIEKFVQDFVGVNVVIVDGQCYDAQSLRSVREDVQARSEELARAAKGELVPQIEASFDARDKNVKSYLDWYFESASNQSYLSGQSSGTPEEFVSSQFRSHIENGIDDAGLMGAFGGFATQALGLKAEAESRLEACRVEDVPQWLYDDAFEVNADFVSVDLGASQKIADAYASLTDGLSEESIPNAIAIKVADLALREESSLALAEAVDAAREGKNKNLLDWIFDAFEPLADSVVNRAAYEKGIKGCINQERDALLGAFPDGSSDR